MTTLTIALVLLALLLVLLVGGVWIAIALATVAWIGLQLFTNTPPEVNLFQAFWGSSANWTIAALPLFIWMGEILYRTKLSERDVRRAFAVARLAPGKARSRERARVRYFRHRLRLFRGDVRHDRESRVAGVEAPRLRRETVPRFALRRRHARHPAAAVHHHGGVRGGRRGFDPQSIPRGFSARAFC